jgi:hypothetical protein
MNEMIPAEARDHPMAKMFITIIREAKKDIKRFPEDQLVALAKNIGDALMWVAVGDMATVADPEEEIDDDDEDYDEDYDEEDEDDEIEEVEAGFDFFSKLVNAT